MTMRSMYAIPQLEHYRKFLSKVTVSWYNEATYKATMATEAHDKKSPGPYGKKAYEHALSESGKEDRVSGKQEQREEEYQKRFEIFRRRHTLQELRDLKNLGKTFEFKDSENGPDTLYPFLHDGLGMNNHTAFLVMMKMMKTASINIDAWEKGDHILLNADGALEFKHQGMDYVIEDPLTPDIAEVEYEVDQ